MQRVSAAAVLIAALALAAPAAALAPGCADGTLCFDTDMPTAPLPCYPGYYCPGNQSAQLCPAGKYCLTSVQMESCPEGYYCPPNTVEPKACSPFASCPDGSDRYFLWGGILLALAPFLLVLTYKYAVVRRSLVGQQPTELEADGKVGAGGLRRAGSVADGGLALNGAPLSSPVVTPDTLAPFSDTGMTMRMLARMSVADRAAPANGNDDPNDDEVGGPNGHGGVAVPMGGVAAAAQRSLAVQPVNLRFDKLVSAVTVDGKPKTIMQSVSGTFRAGRVAAVMGPSGAGKTTLFRILMGKLPVTGGGVLLNDEPADLRQLQGRTGFVPQADVMLTTLTVRDVLVHAARTRLPRDLPDHKKLERVDEIMKALSLTHIQHSIIGDAEAGQRGISGGERKRVSIGIELVANPSVLLLDEPTTGLDSTTSLDVVQLLKTIAKTQRVTVVAVLHQPRNLIFELFDDLLLLAPGGRTVYSGSSSRALNYFAAQGFPCPPKGNPADHFIDVISGANLNADPKREAAAHAAAAAGAIANDGEPQSAAELQVKLVAAWQVEEQKGTHNRSSARGAASGVASGAATPHGAAVPSTPAGGATLAKANGPGAGAKAVEGAGWFEQVWLNLRRGALQQVRGQALNTLLLELSFHLFAGIVIGISFVDKNWFIPPLPPGYAAYCPEAIRDQCQNEPNRDFLQLQATFITMALGLIAAVTGVRTLGGEIMNTSREVAAGSSLTAYFVGKVLCDLPIIVIYSLVFTSTFFVMAAPNSHFDQFFLVMVLFEFVMYSLGYVCSVLFQAQENALIMAVVASLLAGLATDNDGAIKSLAWSRWSSEALFLTEIRADSLVGVTRELFQAYVDNVNFFSLTNFNNDLLALIIFGVVMRLLSLWLLRRRQRLIEASS